MSGPQRIPLGDLASQFPILPTQLADALDTFGPDHIAWAWVVDGRLLRLQLNLVPTADSPAPQMADPLSGGGSSSSPDRESAPASGDAA